MLFRSNPERIRCRKRFVGVYFDDPMSSGYSGFDLIRYLLVRLTDNPDKTWNDVIAVRDQKSNGTFSFKRMNRGGFENNNISISVMEDMKLIPIEDLGKAQDLRP